MSTKKASADSRPLSPFMIGPYYKPQLTSMLSITHRLTGLVLTIGSLFVTGWLASLAAGPQWYAAYAKCMLSPLGQLLLFGWSWSMIYHLCNGIRHLFWDIGKGFDLKSAYTSGYIVVFTSIILTVAVWIIAYAA
jgi:succinate dehydrogenase / fumarate reductase cytochrome b subunit